MKIVKLQLEPLSCPSCIQNIEKALKREKGVQGVKVMFHSSKVKVEVDEGVTPDQLRSVVEGIGYSVQRAI
ncbi:MULTISPECIES: heavy-metal-associated domain-containing protein [Bacillaceae]|uniref:Heavy-metal-associated domain-containing protein n=1 Tax=Evansella alkalicola TaxID=745819 RepID=A0ABS6JYS0_9BACI|nr:MULTISPECIES: heavy metal-associated domain-containing protein [Bacillaceae]MBU9723733.1 heavy-metal-associated domain-containing protein [Bacillus alkalicola]